MTLWETVRSLTAPIGDLGGHWMLHPETIGDCRSWGYPNGYAYYVVGRGGVLGDVDADVVTSAFAFFSPSLIRTMWDRGRGVEGPLVSAERYGASCAQFSRRRLQGFEQAGQLCEMAQAVIDGADVAGLTLFAGWRSQARASDDAGLAGLCLHLLRELRGSVHIVAVVAAGMTPRDAVLVDGGAEQAEKFGWTPPFDDVTTQQSRKAAIEDTTDHLLAEIYRASLGQDATAEFAALVAAAAQHVRSH